jgi:hypothetical protein
MKSTQRILPLFVIILLACGGLSAADGSTGMPINPDIELKLDNEVQALGKGFVRAFRKMPTGPKFIEVLTPSGRKTLDGSIRTMEALDGVLLITMDKGPVYAISARNVVALSNVRSDP